MADPRFFAKNGSLNVGDLADAFGCELAEGVDRSFVVSDVAPLSTAGKTDLSFLDNIKYRDEFKVTKAGACFVSPEMAPFAPENLICLVTKQPYKAYALAAQKFYPEPIPSENISPSAVIDSTAKIGKSCTIEHGAYIGMGVEIGDHVWIEPYAVIRDNVKIGSNCRIGVHATVSHCLMGDYVRLYTGVRVGQDGFGFAIDPKGHVKVPQLGRVLIGSHVEIGANTTIDRGAGPDTVIGSGTWIDNLVQIGHNVQIGRGCVIVAQVGISGSTVLEDFVAIGGQAGIAGHLTIGMGAKVGAQSGVMNNVPSGEQVIGSPAFPQKQFFRQVAMLNRLIKDKKNY